MELYALPCDGVMTHPLKRGLPILQQKCMQSNHSLRIPRCFHRGRSQIELTVGRDALGNGCMTAIVSDGYRIIRHECPCCMQGNGFTAFFKVPKVKPGKYDVVSVVPDDEGVVISFDNISLRYEAPPHDEKVLTISGLYGDIQSHRENMTKMDVDASFLHGLLNGLISGKGETSKKRVTLVVGKSSSLFEDLPYLSLEMDNSEALLLPLRTISKT